jgi:putative cardiolipin synthase
MNHPRAGRKPGSKNVNWLSATLRETVVQAFVCLTLSLLVACTDNSPNNQSVTNVPSSSASIDHTSTVLGRRLHDREAAHPDESGFAIIRRGRQALAARIALTDLAEKSLDVQYYIWEADPTGRILADRLVRAADRGVRVRVLVDDINLTGRDSKVAALDAHPNIEIRIFNPFKNRKFRMLDFALDMARVNHRMHNKTMIADNAIALVGGRNVGAHYFAAHGESNFRDLDIVGVGPIVRDISGVFDRFWNGEWAIPVSQIVGRTFTMSDHDAFVASMRQQIEADNYAAPLDAEASELLASLDTILDDLVWAPGQIVFDDPASIYDGIQSGTLNEAFYDRLKSVESELLIESAYLVPGARGVEWTEALVDRGVRVRILTNSLSSNDVLAAHAGYSKYRKQLIEAGAELYELRPYPGPVDKKIISAGSKAGLHTKALVFDQKAVFIGSFNLDPRSASINTEAGIYVESPELAAQVIDYMAEGVAPENAYRVLLDENGDLRWVIESDNAEVVYSTDPDSRWYQRWLAALIRLLPVEKQL